MAASIFHMKNNEPDDFNLTSAIGSTKIYFDAIAKFIQIEYGEIISQWKFYNQKSGWILKMINQNRNVLFIIPCNRYFKVSFTLGEKAVEKVFEGNFPEVVKQGLLIAKKYAEGRTILIDVQSNEDCLMIQELIRVKLNR
jgi:hypothetical protein